jgi:hypothetical protein
MESKAVEAIDLHQTNGKNLGEEEGQWKLRTDD